MLALQVVAGALMLAGSLALVAFLRWLETQETDPVAARGHLRAVAPPQAQPRHQRTLKRAA